MTERMSQASAEAAGFGQDLLLCRLTAGQDHEAPVLYQLVEAFVEHHGHGVMKRLILDRGFLDGVQIGRCKKD